MKHVIGILKIPCQAVCNKIALDTIADELKNLEKLEKVCINTSML